MRVRTTRDLLPAVAVVGAGLALLAGTAGATTFSADPPPPAAPVDAGAGDQTDPHLDGTLVSYTSEENGGSQIRWHDLATGARGTIPNAGQFDFLSSVSGDRIAYTRITDRQLVRVHDLGTGIDVAIDDVPDANDRLPSIGGDTVAFQRLPLGPSPSITGAEIVVHDLVSGVSTPLTSDDVLDKNPSVSPDGSVVVWTKCAALSSGCDVWRAVRGPAGWDVAPVPGPGEESLPSTDGEVVVFASSRAVDGGLEQDLEVVPLDGRAGFRLEMPSIQRNANVRDGVVTFEHFDEAEFAYELAVWELAVDRVRVLTDDFVDQSLNDVSVGADGTVRAVWTDWFGNPTGFDVRSTSFARTPTTPTSTLVATVGQPVDADGTSTFNARRGVVPLRFAVTDGGAPTCALPTATIAVTRLGAAPSVVDEAVYATSSDQGSTFRIVDCEYQFNLGARALGAGRYRVDVLVAGTPIGSATFALA